MACAETPETMFSFQEEKDLVETFAQQLLDPMEYRVFVAILNHEATRRALAKECGMTLGEILETEKSAIKKARMFLPAMLEEYEKTVIASRRRNRPPICH
jgi:hypothetical protein